MVGDFLQFRIKIVLADSDPGLAKPGANAGIQLQAESAAGWNEGHAAQLFRQDHKITRS
jgi:hypothetical protein